MSRPARVDEDGQVETGFEGERKSTRENKMSEPESLKRKFSLLEDAFVREVEKGGKWQQALKQLEKEASAYEKQLTETEAHLLKYEKALKEAGSLLDRWMRARKGIPQAHLNLLFDDSQVAINKINSILGE